MLIKHRTFDNNWMNDKSNFWLVQASSSVLEFNIFSLHPPGTVTIEDNEIHKATVDKMLKAGVKVATSEEVHQHITQLARIEVIYPPSSEDD